MDRRVVWRGGFSRVQMIKTEEFSGFPIFCLRASKREREKSAASRHPKDRKHIVPIYR